MKKIKWKVERQHSGGTTAKWFNTKKEALTHIKCVNFGIQRLYKAVEGVVDYKKTYYLKGR